MPDFEISHLDHVALRVKDMEASIAWYESVLGLKRYSLPKWGDYPIFMLSGKAGIALFPAETDDQLLKTQSKHVKIDHFAFNLSQKNFEKARHSFETMGQDYTFKDHSYFHSLYLTDLDGHIVELTTLVVDEKTFYR